MPAARWEEVPTCGVCGSREHAPAGEVCRRRYVRCTGCGVVRLYDRVAPGDLHLLYGGYYPAADPAPEELAAQLRNPTFAHRRLRLETHVDAPDRDLFEIGCGDGNFLAYLRGEGWRVGGSEFAADSAALARRRHGIEVAVGDGSGSPPAGSPFPVVAAYHVLEHLYEPADWLAGVRRMLRPGGILHLQVPNRASLTRRATGTAWASIMFPQHVYFYTPATLDALLRRHGLRPLSSGTWDPWHGPGTVASSAVNAARRLVGGGLPWTDRLEPCTVPAARERPRPARRLVDWLSQPLARAEAALGMGAVVDVVARAE